MLGKSLDKIPFDKVFIGMPVSDRGEKEKGKIVFKDSSEKVPAFYVIKMDDGNFNWCWGEGYLNSLNCKYWYFDQSRE